MNPFKTGDVVRCNTDRHTYITEGKNYTVLGANSAFVFITDDDGDRQHYGYTDFDPVAPIIANGVDAAGNPLQLEVADLKPFQRVVLTSGKSAIVSLNGAGDIGFSFAGGSYCSAEIDCRSPYARPSYNVEAVYDCPSWSFALDPEEKGTLVWRRTDAKAKAIEAAEKALEEAKEALAKAEATRAALN